MLMGYPLSDWCVPGPLPAHKWMSYLPFSSEPGGTRQRCDTRKHCLVFSADTFSSVNTPRLLILNTTPVLKERICLCQISVRTMHIPSPISSDRLHLLQHRIRISWSSTSSWQMNSV